MIANTRFGFSSFSTLPPLLIGDWEEGHYEIDVDQDKPHQSQARIITRRDNPKKVVSIAPVHWGNAILSKSQLGKLLHKEPHLISVNVIRDKTSFKVELYSEILNKISQTYLRELNAEIFTENVWRLARHVDWCEDDANREERQHFLLDTIKRSASHPMLKFAAANAITILNRTRYSFARLVFENIRVPYANLDEANLDHCMLMNASLQKVSMSGAWLNGADLRHADLSEVVLGERPSIVCKQDNYTQVFDLKGQEWRPAQVSKSVLLRPNFDEIAFVDGDKISICDINTQKTYDYSRAGPVICLAFNPDGSTLASADKEGVTLVGLESGYERRVKLSSQVTCLTYRPRIEGTPDELAVGLKDGSIKLIDSQMNISNFFNSIDHQIEISQEEVEKIQKILEVPDDSQAMIRSISSYLNGVGYCLRSVKENQKNESFLQAWLMAYSTLTTKINDIDKSINQISFLKECILSRLEFQNQEDSTESNSRLSRLRNGAPINLADGLLLAYIFRIPIRILSWEEGVVKDQMTWENLSLSDWAEIPTNDYQKDYIFIVELGGGFISPASLEISCMAFNSEGNRLFCGTGWHLRDLDYAKKSFNVFPSNAERVIDRFTCLLTSAFLTLQWNAIYS